MLNWLQGLSGGAATFVGSLTGAAIGLVALLLGALFNAHLNRRRDDRIRHEDARASVTAIKAELSAICAALLRNAEDLETKKVEQDEGYTVPDLSRAIRILPHVLPKLGLLDTDTIQAVFNAYTLVQQYYETLIMIGGQPDARMPTQRVFVPAARAKDLARVSQKMSGQIQDVIAKLDAFLTDKKT